MFKGMMTLVFIIWSIVPNTLLASSPESIRTTSGGSAMSDTITVAPRGLGGYNTAVVGANRGKSMITGEIGMRVGEEGLARYQGNHIVQKKIPYDQSDRKKIVIKPEALSPEQQVWESFSYPDTRFAN